MVKSVKAAAFMQAFRTGRTCPCLMRCEDEQDQTAEVVVKLRTGSECSSTGLVCELMAAFLARDLGLPVPEPYLVEVTSDFHQGIVDPCLAERFRTSAGWNFGSRNLAPAFVSWPQLRSIPATLQQTAAEIFAFDMTIQNPDRRPSKPNLLRKCDELVIFDHEMAFSFLYALVPNEYPWDGKGMGFAKDHLFYGGLKGKELSWSRMQGALNAIDGNRLNRYVETIPPAWQSECGDAAVRIREYVELARRNNRRLFAEIAEVLK